MSFYELFLNNFARNCRHIAVTVFCILVSTQSLNAQQNFWPMAEGYTWTYEFVSYPLRMLVTNVAHESVIDGKVYYDGLPNMYGEKWRVSNDSVYGLLGNGESLYFTFNDSIGTVREPWPPNTLEVWVTGKGDDYVSPTGSIHKWFRVHIEPRDLPDSIYFDGYFEPTFADGIGIVRHDGWDTRNTLLWWNVGGETQGNRTIALFATKPENRSRDIPPDSKVYLQLVADLPLEISPGLIRVISKKDGAIPGSWKPHYAGNAPYGFTHVFTPDAPFAENDSITVTLSGAITDSSGNRFDGNGNRKPEGSPNDDYMFWFHTGTVDGLAQTYTAPLVPSVPRVWPNPASAGTDVFLSYTAPGTRSVELRICNVLGQEVYRALVPAPVEGTGTVAVPTNVLDKGLYFFSLIARNGATAIGRFIVQ